MATPIVNLQMINVAAEIILRSGDTSVATARVTLQGAYAPDEDYLDVMGISILFKEGATFDMLAREGSFPHKKLSHAIVAKVMTELALVGYELVLWVTPTADLPDHHTLAVRGQGVAESHLPDDAADALILAFTVVENPYRTQRRSLP